MYINVGKYFVLQYRWFLERIENNFRIFAGRVPAACYVMVHPACGDQLQPCLAAVEPGWLTAVLQTAATTGGKVGMRGSFNP